MPQSNPTTSQANEETPVELNIDVEQWRRDVRTFADATSAAIHGIVAELTEQCSLINLEPKSNLSKSNEARRLERRADQTSVQLHGTENDREAPKDDAPLDDRSESRLSNLRPRLAEQLYSQR